MELKNQTFPHILTVSEQNAHERLDLFLSKQMPHYSRSFFKRLIETGQVTLNDKVINRQGIALKKNDIVTVDFAVKIPTHSQAELPCIAIVLEHPHFWIINKPAKLVVHRSATATQEPSVVDWILHKSKDIACVGDHERPGIVHRLDKDTSGLLIVARTNYAHQHFTRLFKDRGIKKIYRAIVQGHPPAQGSIDLPIGRHPKHRHKMASFAQPTNSRMPTRAAATHYKVLSYFGNYALVELYPITGRTHQIRVHLAAIGHPIIGDPLYNTQKSTLIKRQALHAYGLSFMFDGQEINCVQPEPQDFSQLLNAL